MSPWKLSQGADTFVRAFLFSRQGAGANSLVLICVRRDTSPPAPAGKRPLPATASRSEGETGAVRGCALLIFSEGGAGAFCCPESRRDKL